MTTDVARFTCRAVDLSTLAVVAATAVVTLVAVGSIDRSAVPPIARLCSGALAAAAAIVLRDPARDLLAAVPTTRRTRLLQRSALIVPATLLSAVSLGAIAHLSIGGPVVAVSGVGSVLALLSLGFAATACWERVGPDSAVGVGAAVALVWAGVPAIAPEWAPWLWSAWIVHPWIVIAAASAVTWSAASE